ncbi:MAG: malate synthase G, partial [Devosia sp.]|nr:malate synthase G [Devosia sp.]
MANYLNKSGLEVDALLVRFIETEALPGTGIAAEAYWAGLAGLVEKFMPRNRELLAIRDRMQKQIDDWHHANGPVAKDPAGYEALLREIGYLVPEPADFAIETTGLDPELSTICGPQLVVPVSNARYALNAANARWGSLYDALYGTDAISRDGELAPGKGFNPKRGAAVVARGAAFLDEAFPLARGSHEHVSRYLPVGGTLMIDTADGAAALVDPTQFVGYGQGQIVLLHHGLHAILHIDPQNPIGATHAAGLADIVIESATTTIQDCEDSVAAVDAEDKIGVYRNWLGLMNGTLTDTFEKGGKTVHRSLNVDRVFTGADGGTLTLKGRALLREIGYLVPEP